MPPSPRAHYAHSLPGRDPACWQKLVEHLEGAARLAGERGQKFGAGRAAKLAGLLHDLGKYAASFQRRLQGAADRVDHATAGAKEVMALAWAHGAGLDRAIAELIAYGIAGHHGGLPDRSGSGGCLNERLRKPLEPLDPCWRAEIRPEAAALVPEGYELSHDPVHGAFQLAFLGRMLFSCLVDADFRDTELFYARSEGWTPDRDWPDLKRIAPDLVARLDACLAEVARKGGDSPVNRLRAEILAHVRAGAERPPGLFTLTVPTGGGKTYASLAFALDHAHRHGLDRIVYAIPFTSVIDQTAATFREALGDEVILEHHSALDEERLGGREARDKLRLAMEDWAAPVIVTTNVQFFESLFADRPSRCRKLHNLVRAVIVLDEAQTIPLPLLRPCIAALRELVLNYGCSVILCTATQPALKEPDFKGGFPADAMHELAPCPAVLAQALRRVTIRQAGELRDEDLVEQLSEVPQGLVIVNSRGHALDLYRRANAAGLDGVVHLTTRQYAAHRRAILEEVRTRLREQLPCRLVATSLVEAGVDLDFPCVWRAEAGLDQIAQAAGRCNREGRRPVADSIVTIFRPADHRPPRQIAQLIGDFGRMAPGHADLLSPAAIADYFQAVYWRTGDGVDAQGILDAFRLDATGTDFSYRSVAERFRMIESGLAPVIVARDAPAREALEALAGQADGLAGRIARRLQPYIVQVPPPARALLLARGDVRFCNSEAFGEQFAVLTNELLYHDDTGLLWESEAYLSAEALIW